MPLTQVAMNVRGWLSHCLVFHEGKDNSCCDRTVYGMSVSSFKVKYTALRFILRIHRGAFLLPSVVRMFHSEMPNSI